MGSLIIYRGFSINCARTNATAGKRLLDNFTVHDYHQEGEFSDHVSSDMQQRRNRSTRSLWDPSYVDESWINDRVQLISHLKNSVNTYYPGTLIGITKYNRGAQKIKSTVPLEPEKDYGTQDEVIEACTR
jgi:hypothetical protein